MVTLCPAYDERRSRALPLLIEPPHAHCYQTPTSIASSLSSVGGTNTPSLPASGHIDRIAMYALPSSTHAGGERTVTEVTADVCGGPRLKSFCHRYQSSSGSYFHPLKQVKL